MTIMSLKLSRNFSIIENGGLFTINTNVTNVGLMGALVSEEMCIDEIIDGETNLNGVLEEMGMENVNAEKIAITVVGHDTFSANITSEFSGVPIYERVVAIKEGRCPLCPTVCTWYEDACNDLPANFTAVK